MSHINLHSSVGQWNAIVLLRLWALFSRGIPPLRPVECGDHLFLLRGEQVRVAVGDVYRLVTHTLGDDQRGEAHLDQQAYMAVKYDMHTDTLHTRRLAPALQLEGKEVLGHNEQTLVGGTTRHFPWILPFSLKRLDSLLPINHLGKRRMETAEKSFEFDLNFTDPETDSFRPRGQKSHVHSLRINPYSHFSECHSVPCCLKIQVINCEIAGKRK